MLGVILRLFKFEMLQDNKILILKIILNNIFIYKNIKRKQPK